MVEEPRPAPSRVPPLLLAALISDVAVRDPSSGKMNLIGIFDRIRGVLPVKRAMSLYFRLTEALGYYPVRIDFVQANSERMIARLEGELMSDNPMLSHDAHFDFPPLPFPDEGRYEFRIYASDIFIGSAALVAQRT